MGISTAIGGLFKDKLAFGFGLFVPILRLTRAQSVDYSVPQFYMYENLPDRLVIALAAWCADHLAPGGELVVTGSSLSTDAEIFDHVVGWPLVRRSPGELLSLLESAGLKGEEVPVEAPVSHAGVVVKAGLRPEGLPRS